MKKILFIFVCTLIGIVGHSQTLQYSIIANDANIGDLKVTKSVDGNVLQIEIISEVKVKLFISVDLKYRLNCTYQNGELFYSAVTTYVNGKIHSTSRAEKDGAYYTLTKEGHSSKYLKPITFSGALLYFSEPNSRTNLFSEFDDSDKPIKSIGTHEYQITNPENGQMNEYKYKNGVLESTTVHHKLLTFFLKKKSIN